MVLTGLKENPLIEVCIIGKIIVTITQVTEGKEECKVKNFSNCTSEDRTLI